MGTDIGPLTYDRTLEALEAVVAGREGYVYNRSATEGANAGSCRYFEDDDTPSCIVGHVLASWGLARIDLPMDYTNSDGDEVGDVNRVGVDNVLDAIGVDPHGLDPKVMVLLRTAQCEQDRGLEWGEALANAIEDAEDEDAP